MGDPEGLKGEHCGQQYSEENADPKFGCRHVILPSGDDGRHDGGSEQHAQGQERHHRTRGDELLCHKVRRSPGGGDEEQEQVDTESGEKSSHSSIVGYEHT